MGPNLATYTLTLGWLDQPGITLTRKIDPRDTLKLSQRDYNDLIIIFQYHPWALFIISTQISAHPGYKNHIHKTRIKTHHHKVSALIRLPSVSSFNSWCLIDFVFDPRKRHRLEVREILRRAQITSKEQRGVDEALNNMLARLAYSDEMVESDILDDVASRPKDQTSAGS